MTEPQSLTENSDALDALFEGQVQGLVVLFTPTEKPLQGLAGLLDWRFRGLFSEALKCGFLTGKSGECVYVPATKAGKTYHLILVGADTRTQVHPDTVKLAKKNLQSLKLQKMGISRSDWAALGDDNINKNFKGSSVCLLK